MEFRKMVMITLYARQQKRYRHTEQTFGLCGRGRGWDVVRMALKRILPCEKQITSLGSIQDIGCLGLVHWDDPDR